MTRADLATSLHREIGLSRADSATMVEQVLGHDVRRLAEGENVKISGFGTFVLRDKGERVGRNPKTGIEVPIAPRRVLTFRASQMLRDRIAEAELTTAVDEIATQRSARLVRFRTRLGVAQHVLRYWETRFPQLQPDPARGQPALLPARRRGARPRIHALLSRDGYTVKGVQKLLATKGAVAEAAPAPCAVARTGRGACRLASDRRIARDPRLARRGAGELRFPAGAVRRQ